MSERSVLDTPTTQPAPGLPFTAMAVCGFGLESVVARELQDLGFEDAHATDTGSVRWSTDEAGIARANLWLRTADRVLIVVDEFDAPDFDALFEGTKALDWAGWIGPDAAFPVRARCVRSQLSSVPAVTRAVKRAVVESLLRGHAVDELPETGPTHAIQARLLKDRLTLLLDTTGEALHKRGYRREGGPAPLRETLGAAMLSLCRWRPGRALVDPFCGSGTIPIEAALIATNTAPGLSRSFDAEQWGRLASAGWDEQRELAREAIIQDADVGFIAGYDLAEEALVVARRNAERAGVRELIHLQQRPFGELRAKSEYGVVITNPPYGVRLEERRDAEAVLRTMPVVFRSMPTWSFGVLSDHEDFERLIGQEASKRRKLYNGSIQCTLYRFDGPRAPRPGRSDEPSPPAFGALREADEHRLGEFEAVLAKRWRHFRKWPDRGIEAYRVYDHQVPAIGVTIDRYGEAIRVEWEAHAHGQRSVAQQAELASRVTEVVRRVTGARAERVFSINPGLAQTRPPKTGQSGGADEDELVIREDSLKLGVWLGVWPGEDDSTGVDLELRPLRQWIRGRADGLAVLDLFCGSGSMAAAAAVGGAESLVCVDARDEALDRVEENLRHNGIEPDDRHEFIRSDVKDYLAEDAGADERFDLALVRLPSDRGATATATDWNNRRDHDELLARLSERLTAEGVIVLATQQRSLRLEAPAGLAVTETSQRFCPEDCRPRPAWRSWLISRRS